METTGQAPRAHPHVGGEHTLYTPTAKAGVGSSPRMRGTLQTAVVVGLVHGLIPTYAGNTCLVQALLS